MARQEVHVTYTLKSWKSLETDTLTMGFGGIVELFTSSCFTTCLDKVQVLQVNKWLYGETQTHFCLGWLEKLSRFGGKVMKSPQM